MSFALVGASCGSDEVAVDAAVDAVETTVTTVAPDTEETTSDSEPATTAPVVADESSCTAEQRGDGDYLVVNIPDDDPDGGLVGRLGAGADQAAFGVIPANEALFTDSSYGCEVIGTGVWWEVEERGGPVWVNSFFLASVELSTEALCAAYDEVVAGQSTEPDVEALTELNTQLGNHPAGVSFAINELINGAGGTESYETITGYVGGICS